MENGAEDDANAQVKQMLKKRRVKFGCKGGQCEAAVGAGGSFVPGLLADGLMSCTSSADTDHLE